MNKEELITKTSRIVNKINLKINKHSPEVFIFAGIAGVVTSTVLACKATLKAGEVIKEKNADAETVRKAINNPDLKDKDIWYTEEDMKRDLTRIYTQTGLKIVRLYAPSVVLGTLSIASILNGHNVLKKRNVALAAAYTVVDKSFKEYRKNVVERFGDEIDKELRYNIKKTQIEEKVVGKNGKEKIQKKEVIEPGYLKPDYSDYAKVFDCGSEYHRKDPEYNLMFLRRQQDYANEVLKAKGYLFLNDVYEMLGFPRTKAGQVVGWIYDEKNPIGDNYVDFGIYNVKNEANCNLINGYEYNVILDFNVDGVIFDKI